MNFGERFIKKQCRDMDVMSQIPYTQPYQNIYFALLPFRTMASQSDLQMYPHDISRYLGKTFDEEFAERLRLHAREFDDTLEKRQTAEHEGMFLWECLEMLEMELEGFFDFLQVPLGR